MTQNAATELSGPVLAAASGGPARHLVVLLHGLGADGQDLISLADEWSAALPHAAFEAPNAPQPCDMAPYGYQWFSLQDRSPERLLAGVRSAAPLLIRHLQARLQFHGLSWGQLALVGFSQGTMMSLHVAPRLPQPIAGVVGYSGALVGEHQLAGEAVSRPPMLLIHGDADPVVPVQATAMAAQVLANLDFTVQAQYRPGLGHGIDPHGVKAGLQFLVERLGAGTP